jgi:hypothetical protein
MKVNVNPYKTSGGTKSQISFQNPAFRQAMNELFKVKDTEYISEIDITDEGITATFERY